jgi:hypothetical protein
MTDRRRTRTPRLHPPQSPPIWTVQEIRALGATTDVVTAGRSSGCPATPPTPWPAKAGSPYRASKPGRSTGSRSPDSSPPSTKRPPATAAADDAATPTTDRRERRNPRREDQRRPHVRATVRGVKPTGPATTSRIRGPCERRSTTLSPKRSSAVYPTPPRW